jgi:hypothetical protein
MRRFFESLVGRRWLAWTVLALAMVVIVLSSLTVWVKRQALDADNWVDVSGQLLEDEDVRRVVAADLVDALFTNTDVEARLQQALPPRLGPLAAPAAGFLRQTADAAALQMLERPAVQQYWREANRVAHGRLVAILDGNPKGLVSAEGDSVILDLRSLVTQLGQRLGLQVDLPSNAGQITVLRSDQLSAAQDGVKLIRKLSVALVILALLLLALAVYLGRGFRREILRATALGLVGAGVLLLAVRRIAGNAVIDSLTSPATHDAGLNTWLIATGLLHDLAIGLIIYGLILLTGVFILGPTPWAEMIRRRLAPAMRDHLMIVYAVVALLFLLFLAFGPASGDRRVLGTLVLAALVAGGIEVMRRQIVRQSPPAAG